MKSEQDAPPRKPDVAPALTGAATVPVEFLGPLLAEFPDPVVVTNRDREVVFLNCAAQKLFGESLRPGAPCPLCAENAIVAGTGKDASRLKSCPNLGESYRQVPVLLKTCAPIGVPPLSVNVAPIRGGGHDQTGCFIHIREHTELLAHPLMEQQMATLSSILENFPVPFFLVDPFLVVTHINERMEKLTGYTRSEVVGRMTCGELLNTAQCGTCDCLLKQVMEHKKALSGLRRAVRTRDGREVQVTASASIIADREGRVIGGFEAVRDITPVVEAEQKLDLLTQLTQEGLLMADENHRIIFANTRMMEILNVPRSRIIGMHLGEVLTTQHLDMARELGRLVDQDLQQETRFCSILDKPKNEGHLPRVFETCMAVSRLGHKVITCLYLRDLTSRILIERELQKTNAFLTNIIRNSVNGIVVMDNKGLPLIFNEGAERILGYKAEEMVGNLENFRRFYPAEVAAEMMRRMRSSEYGPPDKLNTTRVTFINKNGEEVPVNFSATIIRERGEEIASVGIFSDLREILKVHEELEAAQAQLVHSEKIASLGRMSAGVAHEINNPLAGILIYAELLQRDLAADAVHRENIAVIINQTMRCQQIVHRLLDFSRQSLGDQKLFDVNEIIHRCVELISHQAFFHNIKIIQQLDPVLPQIVGDPGQLQQVFTNLLLNAADAMNGQGRITIASQAMPQGDGIILTFTDTGCGISPEIRDKIFEPFFTTKPPGEGTGLGLSIVYGVIQRHGGTITADSPQGEGTTFTIRLPLEARDQEAGMEFEKA